MGNWVFQEEIDETVGWFVSTALPDALPGWEGLPWSMDAMSWFDDRSRWWTISLDIPTSVRGMECWMSFMIVRPCGSNRECYVDEVKAIRSGLGDHVSDTYVWDDHEGMWVLAPDDDDEDE